MSPRFVVLTTYGTLQSEYAGTIAAAGDKSSGSGAASAASSSSSSHAITSERRKSGGGLAGFGFAAGGSNAGSGGSHGGGGLLRVAWRRVILDEAHEIKNPSSQLARARLCAARRAALGDHALRCRTSSGTCTPSSTS